MTARDAGYDDFLDAVEAGEPFYLAGETGGWLPPRRVDPETGAADLEQRPLPATGEVLTHTLVNVAAPDFADDVPYVVAVVDFGPVNVTGQLRGIDHEDVDVGRSVALAVGRTETTGDRVLVFEPA